MSASSSFNDRSSDGLPRAKPADAGVDSRALLGFLDEVAQAGLELHDVMLWRGGAVVAEGWRWPYSAGRLRMAHSMTKSVTACAIGMLVDQGRISLRDKVAGFFPEVELDPDGVAARATVEDLLTMRSGQGIEVSGSVWRGIPTSWIDEFFRIPFVHEPGTVYVYSSAASYILSAIVSRVTGETTDEFLRPRLFQPLGMREVRWDIGPDGINPGGNGISFTTADGLKLGILHAQRGLWNGERILSSEWVDLATRKHAGDPGDEYGYHWVVGDGFFAALGVFVQMVMVFPQSNAVLAVNGAMEQSSVLLPHVRKYFPAAFGGGSDRAADEELAGRLESWSRPLEFASKSVAQIARLQGRWLADPNFYAISELEFEFGEDTVSFTIRDGQGAHRVTAGLDSWVTAPAYLPGADLHHGYRMDGMPVAAGSRWLSPDCLELVVHFLESAFRDTFTFTFAGDALAMKRSVNINSGIRAWPVISARRA